MKWTFESQRFASVKSIPTPAPEQTPTLAKCNGEKLHVLGLNKQDKSKVVIVQKVGDCFVSHWKMDKKKKKSSTGSRQKTTVLPRKMSIETILNEQHATKETVQPNTSCSSSPFLFVMFDALDRFNEQSQ